MIFDGNNSTIGNITRQTSIIQGIADQMRLESRTIETITIAATIQNIQMYIEECHIENNRPNNQGQRTTY